MTHNNFAEQLKFLRKKANLTQQLFADRLNVHLQTVSKWERGVSEPDVSLLGDIARIFGVSVGQLVDISGEEVVSGNFSAVALGTNLSKLRHAAGEDQKTLAKALCVSADTVSKWERAKNCPDIDSLIALSRHFSVPFSALYCGKALPAQKTAASPTRHWRMWTIFAAVVVCMVAVGLVLGLTLPYQKSNGGNVSSGDDNVTHVCEYGDWQITEQPTCTKAGKKVGICAQCNSQQTEIVSAVGHSYTTQTVAASCTSQGCVIHTCTSCSDTYTDSYTDVLEHQFVFQSEQPATCTETGSQTYVCADCHATKNVTVGATGHNHSSTVEAPTCTKEGYTLHICTVCGNSYKDTYVSAVAHTPSPILAVLPSCTDSGRTEGQRCAVCNKLLTQQEIVPALGHNLVGGSCTRCSFAVVPSDDSFFQFSLLEDGTYAIVSISENVPADLVLPWMHNERSVTVVFSNALPQNALVKTIVIPQSITRLEQGALYGSTSLQGVYYLGSVSQWLDVAISDYNFMHAHSLYFNGVLLTDLVYPAGLSVVKRNHFHYCSGLKTITFTEDVVEVEWYAFEYCTNAESIIIPHTVLIVGAHAFACTEAVIHCEAITQPNNWDSYWCYESPNVEWGYTTE